MRFEIILSTVTGDAEQALFRVMLRIRLSLVPLFSLVPNIYACIDIVLAVILACAYNALGIHKVINYN